MAASRCAGGRYRHNFSAHDCDDGDRRAVRPAGGSAAPVWTCASARRRNRLCGAFSQPSTHPRRLLGVLRAADPHGPRLAGPRHGAGGTPAERPPGLGLPALATGLAALSLNVTAYNSETFRAGINSIRRGQVEAAMALGMSRAQALRRGGA